MSKRPIPETRQPEGRTWSGPLRGLLFGLASDGVFRAPELTLRAVGSYPAFSPLPLRGKPQRGGLFSVALSVTRSLLRVPECIPSLTTEVTRHRALRSSDFPPRAETRSDPPPFQNQAHPTFRPKAWPTLNLPSRHISVLVAGVKIGRDIQPLGRGPCSTCDFVGLQS